VGGFGLAEAGGSETRPYDGKVDGSRLKLAATLRTGADGSQDELRRGAIHRVNGKSTGPSILPLAGSQGKQDCLCYRGRGADLFSEIGEAGFD